MLSVNGYYENGVCVPSETLVLENKQRVIITVVDDTSSLPKRDNAQLRNALDEFRGHSHAWQGVDPIEYQRSLREERKIVR